VAKTIKPHQVLLIINEFEPIPLIDYLIGKNFVHWLTQDKDGNYLAYFKLNCQKPGLLQRLFGKKPVPCKYHDIHKTTSKNKDTSENKVAKKTDNQTQDNKAFDDIMQRFKGQTKEIDVRHLEMPMPMQTILEHLETLPKNQALFVHHKRVPQFLIPELNKRGFQYLTKEIEPDYTHLIIYKNEKNH
jgi:uncharacterized protein (DUF2249 family)